MVMVVAPAVSPDPRPDDKISNPNLQMAIASAGTAVANAAQYHADGSSKDASEWSACFDEASGTGPCTAYTGSTSSFPPFAVRGKHPEQPYQRVTQMSPNQVRV